MKEYTKKQYAIAYAKRGLAVFPVMPKDKKPATQHGCNEATTDLQKIEIWWNQNPNYNIGIATGSKSGGLFVIDLDVDEEKGKNGYLELREWEREHKELPDQYLKN